MKKAQRSLRNNKIEYDSKKYFKKLAKQMEKCSPFFAWYAKLMREINKENNAKTKL